MTHKHRAVTKEQSGWTHCVLPVSWYPHDDRERRLHDLAHGGVVQLRRCACGAEKLVELNSGRANTGPWVEKVQGQVRALDIVGGIRVQYRVGAEWRQVDILVQVDPWRELRRVAGTDYIEATIQLEDGEPVAATFIGVDGDPVTAEIVD